MKLATLCYLRHDNKTLMLYRNKKENDLHQSKWNGLGGKFVIGESPEECVKREVWEESGLTLEQVRLKGFITFPAFDDIEDWYVFVFVSERFSGELTESPEGELHWIDDHKLKSLNLWEGDHYFIDWLNRDGFFSAKFIYENSELKDYNVTFYD